MDEDVPGLYFRFIRRFGCKIDALANENKLGKLCTYYMRRRHHNGAFDGMTNGLKSANVQSVSSTAFPYNHEIY